MNGVLEIVWLNAADMETGVWGTHPFHAHGGQYWDIGSGNGIYVPAANEASCKLLATLAREDILRCSIAMQPTTWVNQEKSIAGEHGD
jgi:hypothetical protein